MKYIEGGKLKIEEKIEHKKKKKIEKPTNNW